ncbi:MAG: OmpA family protein [Alphaproteobacteria bacterium]
MKNYLLTLACLFGLAGCQTTNAPLPATETIYFNNDSAVVSPMGIEKIQNFIKLHKHMGYHDGYMIYLSGHANTIGTENYNQTLSEQRAEAVRQVLLSNGVAPWRMNTKGYGELYPVADNNTARGLKLNRRVEIRFEPVNSIK